jgi:hypothetical protein
MSRSVHFSLFGLDPHLEAEQQMNHTPNLENVEHQFSGL